MPKYKCVETGFDGIAVRSPGDVFEYAGKPAHWMEVIEEEDDDKPKRVKSPKVGKPKAKASEAGDSTETDEVPAEEASELEPEL